MVFYCYGDGSDDAAVVRRPRNKSSRSDRTAINAPRASAVLLLRSSTGVRVFACARAKSVDGPESGAHDPKPTATFACAT